MMNISQAQSFWHKHKNGMLGFISCAAASLILSAMLFSENVKADNKQVTASTANPVISIQTPKGKLRIELYRQHAPVTVARLIELVEKGYYNKDTIFESRPGLGFVIARLGKSAIPFEFKDEVNDLASRRGSFAISKSSVSGAYLNNLFVGYNKQPDLEKHYFIIGQVLEGLELIEKDPSGQVRSIKSISMVGDDRVAVSLKDSGS